MRPPGPDVHGHLRVVQGWACSRFRRSPSHHVAPPPPEITIAMIVGPASRRPIRALVDLRRAARQSNAALVCIAIWSRVFPSNTCVIGISPRSESPKSRSTTLGTRDHPTRTDPKSAANNEPPNHQMTPIINRSRPGHLENHAHRGAGFDIVPERPPGIAALPAQCHTGLPREGDPVCSPGYETGRRRGRSYPRYLRAIAPMVRRWASGTPKRHSGPEGRCRKSPHPEPRPGPGQRQRPRQRQCFGASNTTL